MKGTMTVLLHTVEYDTNGIWIDEDAEDILHDIVCDRISCDKKTEGAEVLELEDNEENRLPVDVSWKIVNPEVDKLRQNYQESWDQREAHYRKIDKEKEKEYARQIENWKQIAATVREEYRKEINNLTDVADEYYKEIGSLEEQVIDKENTIENWKQLATQLYNGINQHCYKDTATEDLIKAVEKYEELIKQTTHE
jgi:predicted  nucleic acid-binding Zn-ribbon protein